MRSVRLIVLLVVMALTVSGCSSKPSVRISDIESVRFHSLQTGREWTAPDDQIERFVAAYSDARPLSGDFGTTPPARIIVQLKNGKVLTVFGGGETYQTVELDDRQSIVRGQQLHYLLQEIADGG